MNRTPEEWTRLEECIVTWPDDMIESLCDHMMSALADIAEQAAHIKELEEALEDLKASNLGCSDFIVLQRLMETAIKMYEVKS